MESPRPTPMPGVRAFERQRTLAELTAAIDLVALGSAHRVIVACVAAVDAVAAEALAHAQQAGVGFSVARDAGTGAVSVVVGPREA